VTIWLDALRKSGPAARDLRRNYERVLVREARRLGASWAEIGQALGISRQAVRQAYGADDHDNTRDSAYVLHRLAKVRSMNVEWERNAVRGAREEGASWAAIADALGQSRQAVWTRHHEAMTDLLVADQRPRALDDLLQVGAPKGECVP